jgi:hypothetical protein
MIRDGMLMKKKQMCPFTTSFNSVEFNPCAIKRKTRIKKIAFEISKAIFFIKNIDIVYIGI